MDSFTINGWKLPINKELQKCLTEDERNNGAIITDLNLEYFLEHKPDN